MPQLIRGRFLRCEVFWRKTVRFCASRRKCHPYLTEWAFSCFRFSNSPNRPKCGKERGSKISSAANPRGMVPEPSQPAKRFGSRSRHHTPG